MAVLVLLVLAAGEPLLGRNYASTDAPRTWPRQPVGPVLLTMVILALLVFLATLVVTALGRSLLDQDGGWIPPADSHAWAAVFGASLAIPAIPWWPATLAGALPAGAAVIIAAVPVRTFAGANVVRVPVPGRSPRR